MVASHDLTEDKAITHTRKEAVGNDKIVDAPTDVLLSCLHHIAPPGIFDLIRIEGTEGIGKARGEQLGKFCALLIGKSRAVVIGFGVLEVNLLVSDIQVAAIYHGLDTVKLGDISAQSVLPAHAVIEPRQLTLGVGRIDAKEVKVLKFECDGTSLGIMLGNADAVTDGKRLSPAKDCRTRIPLLLCTVPILVIPRRFEIRLSGLHFGLLDTEDIRIRVLEKFRKSLAEASAEAIDVP